MHPLYISFIMPLIIIILISIDYAFLKKFQTNYSCMFALHFTLLLMKPIDIS